ncbi:hypothetical protein [Acinetobacter gerneri]|jgi:hypothetical protein|uniref:hypothetical protein n=1 Tax=Acinetobacter gerneri TaxID=202952 RepID=UPI0023F326A1|nr:hypothetical protein [Acinetobacter gerneri]MCH4245933.1 hypothetical protein [Acinetobacter gerneri]
MKKTSSSNDSKSTILGWKFVAIVAFITSIFFTFLYLAMSNEPDYMPSHQRKIAKEKNLNSIASQPVDNNASKSL